MDDVPTHARALPRPHCSWEAHLCWPLSPGGVPSLAANSCLMPSPAQGSPSFRLQTLQPRLPDPHTAPAWMVLGTNRLRLCSGTQLCPRGIWGSSAHQQGPAGDPAHHPAVLRPGPGLLQTPGAPSRGRSCPPSPASEGPSFSPVFWAARDRLRPSHRTLSPPGRPTLPPLDHPSPSPSGSLGLCCGLLLPRWGLQAWSCRGHSRKSLDPHLPRGQEAQPHFPSARVLFHPPEPGTLGCPPCGQAGGTHSQANGQDTCARWRPHGHRAVCVSGKEEASVMQPTNP